MRIQLEGGPGFGMQLCGLLRFIDETGQVLTILFLYY